MTNWVRKHMAGWEYPADIQPTELAYLAGIIDGEGAIGMHMHTKRYRLKDGTEKTYSILQPMVMIYNTDLLLINWLRDRIGFRVNSRDRRKARTSYQVAVSGSRTHGLLTPLLPFLLGKKKRAELLIEFTEIRAARADVMHNTEYGERESEIFVMLQEMNWKKFDPFVPREFTKGSTI